MIGWRTARCLWCRWREIPGQKGGEQVVRHSHQPAPRIDPKDFKDFLSEAVPARALGNQLEIVEWCWRWWWSSPGVAASWPGRNEALDWSHTHPTRNQHWGNAHDWSKQWRSVWVAIPWSRHLLLLPAWPPLRGRGLPLLGHLWFSQRSPCKMSSWRAFPDLYWTNHHLSKPFQHIERLICAFKQGHKFSARSTRNLQFSSILES